MLVFSSVTLKNIMQKNFPEEYAERQSEDVNVANPGVDLIPLFVMDIVLPCEKLPLNIFEPRYRLMVSVMQDFNYTSNFRAIMRLKSLL